MEILPQRLPELAPPELAPTEVVQIEARSSLRLLGTTLRTQLISLGGNGALILLR